VDGEGVEVVLRLLGHEDLRVRVRAAVLLWNKKTPATRMRRGLLRFAECSRLFSSFYRVEQVAVNRHAYQIVPINMRTRARTVKQIFAIAPARRLVRLRKRGGGSEGAVTLERTAEQRFTAGAYPDGDGSDVADQQLHSRYALAALEEWPVRVDCGA
jgi:hypothetical protein